MRGVALCEHCGEIHRFDTEKGGRYCELYEEDRNWAHLNKVEVAIWEELQRIKELVEPVQ